MVDELLRDLSGAIEGFDLPGVVDSFLLGAVDGFGVDLSGAAERFEADLRGVAECFGADLLGAAEGFGAVWPFRGC